MKKCTVCGAQYADDAVVCANDRTPLESALPQTGNPSLEEKHSGIGIISFIMSLAIGFLIMAVFIVAAVLSSQRSIGARTYPGQTFVGLAVLFLLAMDVVAIALGIVSLCRRGRKRLYGILGLVFSSAILLGTVGLMIIGLVYMSKVGR